MNTPLSFLRKALVAAILVGAAAQTHAAQETTMSVDADAPVQATLLPEVTVIGDSARPNAPARMSVADTAPLQVTLLPTVHVTAHEIELAEVTLPVVHVFGQVPKARIAEATSERTHSDADTTRVDAAPVTEQALPSRPHVMPQ